MSYWFIIAEVMPLNAARQIANLGSVEENIF